MEEIKMDEPGPKEDSIGPVEAGQDQENLSIPNSESPLDCSIVNMASEADEDPLKDVNQIQSLYAIKPFPSSSKNNKLSKAPFEDLDPTLHAQKACHNGLRNGLRTTADLPQVYFQRDHGRHTALREISLQDPSKKRWGNRLVGLTLS